VVVVKNGDEVEEGGKTTDGYARDAQDVLFSRKELQATRNTWTTNCILLNYHSQADTF
jgi:hypothetical protein